MRIHIVGEITAGTYKMLSRKLFSASERGESDITVLINSEGGDAYAAFAIHDLFDCYRENFAVTTVGIGLVASAATLILAAGDVRQLHPNAWVMVHEDATTVGKNTRVTDAELAVLHARRLEDQWNRLLASRTKLSAEEWAGINSVETFLTPSECLEYGLVDEII